MATLSESDQGVKGLCTANGVVSSAGSDASRTSGGCSPFGRRRIERGRLHVDLTILAQLATEVARSRAVSLAAVAGCRMWPCEVFPRPNPWTWSSGDCRVRCIPVIGNRKRRFRAGGRSRTSGSGSPLRHGQARRIDRDLYVQRRPLRAIHLQCSFGYLRSERSQPAARRRIALHYSWLDDSGSQWGNHPCRRDLRDPVTGCFADSFADPS